MARRRRNELEAYNIKCYRLFPISPPVTLQIQPIFIPPLSSSPPRLLLPEEQSSATAISILLGYQPEYSRYFTQTACNTYICTHCSFNIYKLRSQWTRTSSLMLKSFLQMSDHPFSPLDGYSSESRKLLKHHILWVFP